MITVERKPTIGIINGKEETPYVASAFADLRAAAAALKSKGIIDAVGKKGTQGSAAERTVVAHDLAVGSQEYALEGTFEPGNEGKIRSVMLRLFDQASFTRRGSAVIIYDSTGQLESLTSTDPDGNVITDPGELKNFCRTVYQASTNMLY